jgi:hypothetical protein
LQGRGQGEIPLCRRGGLHSTEVDTELMGVDTELMGFDTELTGVDTELTGVDTELFGVDNDNPRTDICEGQVFFFKLFT